MHGKEICRGNTAYKEFMISAFHVWEQKVIWCSDIHSAGCSSSLPFHIDRYSTCLCAKDKPCYSKQCTDAVAKPMEHCPQSNVRNSLRDISTGGFTCCIGLLWEDIWEVVSSSQLELFISHPTSCFCLKINRVVDNPSDCCKQTLWFPSFF